jgi:copper(I)-binding protein
MKHIALSLCLLAASLAQAQVTVKDAWVRGTVPQQKASGAFMQLTSEKEVRLVAAKSPVANVVEIHEMVMDKDVMKMRQIAGLDLVPGRVLELKPGGYHVMLIDLKQPLKKGDTVPLKLRIENADKSVSTVEVKAEVRDVTAPSAAHQHQH